MAAGLCGVAKYAMRMALPYGVAWLASTNLMAYQWRWPHGITMSAASKWLSIISGETGFMAKAALLAQRKRRWREM